MSTLRNPRSRFVRRRLAKACCPSLQWRALSVNTAPNTLGVPLRARERPVRPDKAWHRHIGTNLKADGPEWISFQVLARSGRRCKGGCGPTGTNVGRQPEREYPCGIRQAGRSRKLARFSVSGVLRKHFAVAGPGRVCKSLKTWTGRRGSNPRPTAWKNDPAL
jgi:hypothetical protein